MLKNRIHSAFFWNIIDILGGKLVLVVCQILIARVLIPEDFGLFAILMVFVTFSNVLIEGGLGSALIQKKRPTQKDFSTVFFFKLGSSIIIYFLFWMLVPYIAIFYDNDTLISTGRIIALVFIFNALAGVHMTILIKDLDFKAVSIRTFIVNLVSGLSGIGFAYLGWGVWSLIYMMVIQALVNVIVLWPLVNWKPTLVFSVSSYKELFGFGSKIAMSSILSTSFNELNKIVIGKAYPISDLGYYTKAVEIRNLGSQHINSIFSRILFPAFSEIQDNTEVLRKSVLRAVEIQSIVTFPILFILIFFADNIVLFMLGPKWIHMVPFLQILSVIPLISPLNNNAKNLMMVKGRSDFYLNTEIYRKVLYFLNIIISHQFGIFYFLYGLIFISVIGMIINLIYAKKASNLSIMVQVIISLKIFFICSISMIPSLSIINVISFTPIIEFIGGVLLFLSMVGFFLILFRYSIVNDVRLILNKYLKFMK